MSKKEIIEALITQAKNHKKTARDLYTLKHYDWCLFLWHLAIEKLLKAKLLSLGKEIIYTHNIVRLYKLAGLPSDKDLEIILREITTFNLETRYDDYKFSFYKRATEVYTDEWVNKSSKLYRSIFKSL